MLTTRLQACSINRVVCCPVCRLVPAHWICWRSLLVIVVTMVGCSGQTDPSSLLYNGAAFAEVQHPRFSIIAAHTEGSLMGVEVSAAGGVPIGVVATFSGRSIRVIMDGAGRPQRAITGDGYVAVFDNYTAATFDVYVIAPSGEVVVRRGLSLPSGAFAAQAGAAANAGSLTFHEFNKLASLALSVAACGAAVATGGAFAWACGLALLDVALAYSQVDNPAIEASVGALGIATGSCGPKNPFECAGIVAELINLDALRLEREAERRDAEVAGALASFRFGGTWENTVAARHYAAISTAGVTEALWSATARCYNVFRAAFVKYAEGWFTYVANESEVQLKYQVDQAQARLTITRRSDNRIWLFARVTPPTSFTPVCSGSATPRNGAVLNW